MKFTTENIEIIRDMLYLPCKIIDGDVPILFSKNGISICAMDQAHICLVICDIPSNMFTKIDCKEDRSEVLNATDFQKILLKIKKSDKTTFELIDNRLVIKQKKSRWSLNFLEENIEPPNLKSILENEHESKMQLDVSLIKEAISNLEIYDTESTTFLTSNNTLTISTGATNIGDYELVLGKEDLTEFESTEDSEGMFSVQHLKIISEIDKISKRIQIEYSTDAFLLFKTLSDDFKMWIMLAARTEDDLEDDD